MSETLSLPIPIAGPSITDLELEYVQDALKTAWYQNANKYNQRFEARFAAYVGRRYAVSLPSCTSALHLALAALHIGPGDEVIVPDLTWIASSAPITYMGATPRFADVDPQTWCLCPRSAEALITPKTRAIIAVDLYGHMPQYEALIALAERHQIPLIEDAAEAFGSEYQEKKAGSFGLASTFSFHGSKTMTTGEGGMLVTDDPDFFQRVLILRDHGRHPQDKSFWNQEIAFKYKMSSLQAALGLAQVERADALVEKKRAIFAFYARELKHLPVQLNPDFSGTYNSYWMSSLLLNPEVNHDKESFQKALLAYQIDTRPMFYPLSSLPAYERATDTARARQDNMVSYDLSPRGINLPSALSLSEAALTYVCQNIVQIIGEAQ